MTTFDNSVKGFEGSQEFFHYEDTGCEISTSSLLEKTQFIALFDKGVAPVFFTTNTLAA